MSTYTITELAKRYNGHEISRLQTQGHDYTNVTYEFKSRKDARGFQHYIQHYGVSKYSPFFCDEFKYAQVTVFEPLETGKE